MEFISDEVLVEKYGRLCSHIARCFVARSNKTMASALTREDAEDLSQVAHLAIIRCPQHLRDQPPYIKRIIVSKIITAWQKMCKQKNNELSPDSMGLFRYGPTSKNGGHHENWESGSKPDYFDTLEGRDGVFAAAQHAADYPKIRKALKKLPKAERIVIEMYYGLGRGKKVEPLSLERIAKKLGRSKMWVSPRLAKGIMRLRTQFYPIATISEFDLENGEAVQTQSEASSVCEGIPDRQECYASSHPGGV